MRILSLTLSGYKCFGGKRTLQFGPGLSVIKGDNETGKSTLLQAIIHALFTFPTTITKVISDETTWGKEPGFLLELELEDGSGERYLLEKDYGKRQWKLSKGGEEIASSSEGIKSQVALLTGCADQEFFVSTACVRQGDLQIGMNKGGKSISERLRNLGGGQAGLDVEGMLSDLHSEATSRAKDASGPAKRLDDAQRTLSRLEEEIARFTPQVQDILNKRKLQVDNEVKLAELKEIFDPKKDVLQKNLRLQEIIGELTKLADENDPLEKALTCRGEIKKLEEELGELPPITEMEWEHIKKTKGSMERIASYEDKAPLFSKVIGLILGGLGVASSLAGVIWGYLSTYDPAQIILIISGAVSAVVGGVLFLLGRKVLGKEVERESLQKQLEDALSELKVFDFEELEDKYERKKVIEFDLEKERIRLETLVGEKDEEQLKDEKKRIGAQYSALSNEQEDLKPYAVADVEELTKKEQEVEKLEKEIDTLEDELQRIEGALSASQADPEQLTALEEEQEELQKRIAYYQDRCEVLKLTEELLRQAHQEVLASAVPIIEEELGKHISTITDGRYKEVEINADDLSIKALAPESGEMVSIEELSTATQDQFYLVARLGFLRHLTGEAKPPLILDDITANFDPVRREATRSILGQLSRDYQVLLFTCHDYHDDWGRLIELKL